MGDQAEKRFEEKSPWPFYRYGLNRPDFKLNQVSQMVRHTPDYLTEQYLIEVQVYAKYLKQKSSLKETNTTQ